MAESADAAASKAVVRKDVRVQVPLRARTLSDVFAGRGAGDPEHNDTKCSLWSQVGHKRWDYAVIATSSATTAVIVVSALLGGIVSLGIILGWLTKRGRRVRQGLRQRVSRRPTSPRTRIHIQPKRQVCWWSKANTAHGEQVGFEMQAVLTNLTPGYDVRIVEAEMQGVEGAISWNAITSFRPGRPGGTAGATLPPNAPIDVSVNVVLDRPLLAPGPHVARVVLVDHLGQRHTSPKISFLDVKKYDSPTAAPEGAAARPDLNNPQNRPPWRLPPKPLQRIRRQTGGSFDPT